MITHKKQYIVSWHNTMSCEMSKDPLDLWFCNMGTAS